MIPCDSKTVPGDTVHPGNCHLNGRKKGKKNTTKCAELKKSCNDIMFYRFDLTGGLRDARAVRGSKQSSSAATEFAPSASKRKEGRAEKESRRREHFGSVGGVKVGAVHVTHVS